MYSGVTTSSLIPTKGKQEEEQDNKPLDEYLYWYGQLVGHQPLLV